MCVSAYNYADVSVWEVWNEVRKVALLCLFKIKMCFSVVVLDASFSVAHGWSFLDLCPIKQLKEVST